jgi:hypothetical protein
MSQAVAAVVAGGTQTAQGSHWGVGAAWSSDETVPLTVVGGTRSTQQTELARMLDMPAPRPPAPVFAWLGVLFVVGGFMLAGITALFAFALTPMNDPGAIGTGLVIAAVAGLVVGGLPVLVGWLLLQYGRTARKRWEAEHAVWCRAAPIAERLVYCNRDHVVYDPSNANRWMHPAQARTYTIDLATG